MGDTAEDETGREVSESSSASGVDPGSVRPPETSTVGGSLTSSSGELQRRISALVEVAPRTKAREFGRIALPLLMEANNLIDRLAAAPLVEPPHEKEVSEPPTTVVADSAESEQRVPNPDVDGSLTSPPLLPHDPGEEEPLQELREQFQRASRDALTQQIEMPQYAEFWRGRDGAFRDALSWLAHTRAVLSRLTGDGGEQ